MDTTDRPAFSNVCPVCSSGHIDVRRQHNDFLEHEGLGFSEIGRGHVSTTREYTCRACNHAWREKVPYTDPGKG